MSSSGRSSLAARGARLMLVSELEGQLASTGAAVRDLLQRLAEHLELGAVEQLDEVAPHAAQVSGGGGDQAGEAVVGEHRIGAAPVEGALLAHHERLAGEP